MSKISFFRVKNYWMLKIEWIKMDTYDDIYKFLPHIWYMSNSYSDHADYLKRYRLIDINEL